MGRINSKQMGPLYRRKWFQDTIQFDSPLSTVPISLSQSSSPLLREEIAELLQNIVLRICHIPGKFNIIVDSLSRLDRPHKIQWSLDQSVENSIFHMLNFPNVDLFATRFNHKLPLYVSPALTIDALSMNWNFLHAYA